MSPLVIVLLVVVLIAVSGGFYGHQSGFFTGTNGYNYGIGGGVGFILLILLILWIFGALR